MQLTLKPKTMVLSLEFELEIRHINGKDPLIPQEEYIYCAYMLTDPENPDNFLLYADWEEEDVIMALPKCNILEIRITQNKD